MSSVIDVGNIRKRWNTLATAFTGIGLHVVDQASDPASLLLNLSCGPTTTLSPKFTVDKDGNVDAQGDVTANAFFGDGSGLSGIIAGGDVYLANANVFTNTNTFRDIAFGGVTNTYSIGATGQRPLKLWVGTGGIDATGAITASGAINTTVGYNVASTAGFWGASYISLPSTAYYSFSSSANTNLGTEDVKWYRGGPGILEQRNGANSQTFNLYDSYTDASNYARLSMMFSSGYAYIKSQKLGTGVNSGMYLDSAGQLYYNAGTSASSHTWYIASTGYMQLVNLSGTYALKPVTDGGTDLGGSAFRWTKGWFGSGGIDLSGSVNFTTSGSTIGHSTSVLWRFLNTANISLMNSTTERMRFGGSGIELNSGHYLGWNSTGSPTGSPDTILLRGGVGILEQRNGVNAQTWRLHRTYTDASNQAYLEQIWSGNNALIRTVGAGTGTVGELRLYGGSSGFSLQINASGFRLDNSAILYWGTRTRIAGGAADGQLNLTNAAATGFTRFTLGPESVNFPSLKVNSGYGIDLRDGNDSAFYSLNLLTAGLQGVTYANRPATPAIGMIVCITDSNTATWGATIAGGGANNVIAFYNGTNWTVVGV